MKTSFKKRMEITIALFLVSTMVITFNAFSTTSAQTTYNYDAATLAAKNAGMTWDINYNASATRLLLWNRFHDQIPTHVYLMAAPNPVGINEPFNLVMFQPQVPPDALISNNIRYQYTVEITMPDGTKQTLPASGSFTSDSTGSQYTQYTSNQIGNLSAKVNFLKLFYNWDDSSTQRNYYGTTFLASSYTLPIVVRQEPSNLIDLPLIQYAPTEYWTRPIEGQNTYWANYASNWLGNAHDNDNGGSENRFQEDGTAPNSGHILWTRPTEDNGVVGGSVGRFGNVFNAGSQYQPRFNAQVIMYGRLYYTPNIWYQGTSEMMDVVDLKTGQLLYEVNTTGVGQFAFGYQYSFDDPNEHGIVNPGYIFTNNYARAYQPERGIVSALNISNVPSGFEVNGPAGENLRYVLTNLGTSSNPNYYLLQWNSSRVIPSRGNPTAARIPGNVPITPGPSGTNTNWNGSMWVSSSVRQSQGVASVSDPSYDWNVSFPIAFTSSPTVRAAVIGDILWGSNGSWPTGTSGPSFSYPDEVTVWAVSLKPGTIGQLIYKKNIVTDNPVANTNNMIERASGPAGVFVTIEVPIQKFHVYSIRTGEQLFETDAQSDFSPYGYFTWPSLISETQTKLAYGMLYTGGYTGSVSAYNLTTGKLQWRETAPSGGAKIQNYVLMLGMEADGKIYVGTHEHSADTPLYKGEHVRVYDAYTGDIVWQMAGWAYPMTFATADGVLIYWNNYDAQIYAIGKGPSSTTVDASPKVSVNGGGGVLIEGNVIDVSAGTKQQEQAARFPNGVPAVSDATMSEWMEYVYMQKGRPTDTVGVDVKVTVIDPNMNTPELTATSDSLGHYSLMWDPPVPGKYTVIANFAGSESYWPSMAETAFGVAEAPSAAPTATPTLAPTPAVTPTPVVTVAPTNAPNPTQGLSVEIYVAIAAAVVIVAIAAAALVLRKRPK